MRRIGQLLLLGMVLACGQAGAQQLNCPYAWMGGGSAFGGCSSPAPKLAAASSNAPAGVPLGENTTIGASVGSGRATAGSMGYLPYGREGLERNYAGAHLNNSYWFGRSQFSTRFSLLQGEEKLGGLGLGAGYSPDYRSTWSQASATARYGYYFEGFTPYASVTLASDLTRSGLLPGMGRQAWIPRVGVDFFARRGLTGGIAYSAEQGSAVKNEVWSANLNYKF
jgi:hypothetical protein